MEKCEIIPLETLIEYCDGELEQQQAEQIAQHISGCQICKANVEALQNSLKITYNIWQSDIEKWGDLHSFNKPKSYRLTFKSIAAVAAGIILICGVSVIWLFSNSDKPGNGDNPIPTVAEIEIQAERVAIAAQLLAVGDMYASLPGAEKYAIERYNDLIESFPSSPQSEQAKLHLQKLLERKTQ